MNRGFLDLSGSLSHCRFNYVDRLARRDGFILHLARFAEVGTSSQETRSFSLGLLRVTARLRTLSYLFIQGSVGDGTVVGVLGAENTRPHPPRPLSHARSVARNRAALTSLMGDISHLWVALLYLMLILFIAVFTFSALVSMRCMASPQHCFQPFLRRLEILSS